jgi:hypothetical protein
MSDCAATIPQQGRRKHPFVEGRCYLARESFRGYLDSEFVAGVLYEFQHVGYSRYDSSTVFAFRAEGDCSVIARTDRNSVTSLILTVIAG